MKAACQGLKAQLLLVCEVAARRASWQLAANDVGCRAPRRSASLRYAQEHRAPPGPRTRPLLLT